MSFHLQKLIGDYRKKLISNPEDEGLLYNLSMLYISEGNITDAQILAEKLLNKNNLEPRYLNLYGLILQRGKRYSESIAYFEKAISFSDREIDFYNNLAISYTMIKNYDKALEFFEGALEIEKSFDLHFNYAILLRKLNRFFDAEKQFQKAGSIDPSNEGFYVDFSDLLIETKSYNRALEFVLEGLKRFKNSFGLLINLAALKTKIDDKSDSSKLFEEIRTICNNNLSLLGNVADKLEKFEIQGELNLYTEEILRIDSANKAALKLSGRNYFNTGKFEEAIKTYNEIITGYPEDFEFFLEYSDVLIEFEKFEQADKLISKAFEIAPNKYSALLKKSELNLLSGNFKQGFGEYDLYSESLTGDIERNLLWNGEPLEGKTLLVKCGFELKDFIQFGGIVSELKKNASKIVVQLPNGMEKFIPQIDGIDSFIGFDKIDHINYDYEVSLQKLLSIFEVNKIKNKDNFRFALRKNYTQSEKLKINISLYNEQNSFLNQNLEKLKESLSFLNSDKYEFVLILWKYEKPDYEFIRKNKIKTIKIFEITDLAEIFSETDLFITVDNFLAHLAARLEIPTWLILPIVSDWRWHPELVFYNSFEIFRQKSRFFWQDVIQETKFRLVDFDPGISSTDLLKIAFEYTDQKKYEQAIHIYNKVLQKEENSEAYFRLGYINGIKGDYEKAIGYYYAALELSPGDLNIYNNIGSTLKEMKKFEESEKILQVALEHFPENKLLLNNIAIVKGLLNKFDEALKLLKRTLEQDPDFDRTYINLSQIYQALNKRDEAIEYLKKAIKISPDNAQANFNYSCSILKKKNFTEGLIYYEWRKKLEEYQSREFPKPELNCDDINGKKIYVYDEQGFGDTIQFARYLSLLKAKGAVIYFECHKPLLSLFDLQSYTDMVFTGKDRMFEKLEYDFQVSLLSLPLYFKTTYESIYSPEKYIYLPIERNNFLEAASDQVNIGIVWKGRLPVNNLQRAAKLDNFISLLGISGIRLHSLQKDNVSETEKKLMQKWNIRDYSEELSSFLDTAKILEKLDLIITIDTSVAHLAGALGKTVWLLLPFNSDWRWFDDGTSVWYPKTRIFRQKSHSGWSQVFSEVLEALNEISK